MGYFRNILDKSWELDFFFKYGQDELPGGDNSIPKTYVVPYTFDDVTGSTPRAVIKSYTQTYLSN